MASDNEPACQWGLYVILDAKMAAQTHVEVARQVIAGGARVIQLRDKQASFEELLAVGAEIRAMTREAGVALIVNDNPYLANEIDADGVHVGQEDFPVEIVRDIIGPDKILGFSTHSKQQVIYATQLPVDYIGIGPVYQTSTKQSSNVPVGTSLIRWTRQNTRLPIVAIGGISDETIPDVAAAGAHNIAVISALMTDPDILARTQQLQRLVGEYQHE